MAEMAENTYVFSGSEEELDRLLTCIKRSLIFTTTKAR